jgi:hypothetical protein
MKLKKRVVEDDKPETRDWVIWFFLIWQGSDCGKEVEDDEKV